MKLLNIYINESEVKHPLWCMVAMSMFKNGKKLTKESVKSMIETFCDVEGRMKKFSDYLADEYPKEYLAYQPNDDEFLADDKKDKISDQIADFIVNYII